MSKNFSTNPDDVIEFTQQARYQLQADEEDKKLKLSILDSMSFVALNVKKIKTDDLNSIADREIAVKLATSFKNIKEDPFLSVNNSNVINNLPEFNLVKDETSKPNNPLDFEEIIGKK